MDRTKKKYFNFLAFYGKFSLFQNVAEYSNMANGGGGAGPQVGFLLRREGAGPQVGFSLEGGISSPGRFSR